MCNLYRLNSAADAIRALFDAREGPTPNLPETADFYPDRPAPVILATPTGRALGSMTWGVPPPPGVHGPVTNIRNLASPFWRPLLANRCLVPVSAFCEWSAVPDPATGRKTKHWFALRSAPVFAFAGLWRAIGQQQHFAFLTCAPNATVGAIHPKAMPVLLTGTFADQWLAGAPADQFQHPWPDADMMLA
jgi:putative SOS response-associated peptidase YedK